ncbi:amidase [Coccomyxa subellipsoidea C-169]|uniref:Amidase n=1 Tax=Coccomyxa subellipsoidea (strain C-169) TaxID=574566 RepID=I0YWM3_COCSC|nr:amidase [Coccomyxa subellipsoidea C-169]EIE22792.1 amidase [Coccomyxa subellipsoidea C-169]|eukprot:XP_005647336.1 amidase [Coccomyxa subellipsoidea C-169]
MATKAKPWSLQRLFLAFCLFQAFLDHQEAWAQIAIAEEGPLPLPLLQDVLYREPAERIQLLGKISDAEGSLYRRFFSPAHIRAASQIRRWMKDAGMRTWQDGVGNVHGRIDGRARDAPALISGSHYDTVMDAGKYDGALGIIVAIASVKATILQAALATRIMTPEEVRAAVRESADLGQWLGAKAHNLFATPMEIIAFSDEEGVRFQTTFLGSRAVTGQLVPLGMLDNEDQNGESLADVLYKHGFQGSEEALARTAYSPEQVRGYVEVHMEQGPVLQARGYALGPVAAIAGQTRLAASVIGTQGHAGTVPMKLRQDAAAAAAETVVWIEQHCGGGAGGDEKTADAAEAVTDDSLVCTTGSMVLWPGASNVIAGAANFSVDIRCRSDEVRKATTKQVIAQLETICQRRNVNCSVEIKHEAPAAACHPDIIAGLIDACRESEQLTADILERDEQCQAECDSELSKVSNSTPQDVAGELLDHANCGGTGKSSRWEPGKAPVLVSGAGHDALPMAEITKMGLLFVRDRRGISHSPLEYVADEDIAAAAVALYVYLQKELL